MINRALYHVVPQVTCLASIGCVWFTYLYFRTRLNRPIRDAIQEFNKSIHAVLLFSVVVICNVITSTVWFSLADSSLNVLLVTTVIVENCLIIYVFETLLKKYMLVIENAHLKELLTYQEHNYMKSTRAFNAIKKSIHDTNKHLLYIEKCIEENCPQTAVEHIKKTRNQINHCSNVTRTGNLAIDTFVSNALSLAQENQIHMDYSINISSTTLKIDNYDLCILLGNILDNAIEAARSVQEIDNKQIQLRIFSSNYALFIHVINTRTEDIEHTKKQRMNTLNFMESD